MPRRPQKRTAERRRQRPQSSIAIDPLVGPGNPPHRHPPRAKTDQPRSRHCMVHLATRTSSHRSKSPCQAKYATVMLSRVDWCSKKMKMADRTVCHKKKAIQTNVAGGVYKVLYDARNRFLHGEPVTRETLRVPPCNKQ